MVKQGSGVENILRIKLSKQICFTDKMGDEQMLTVTNLVRDSITTW